MASGLKGKAVEAGRAEHQGDGQAGHILGDAVKAHRMLGGGEPLVPDGAACSQEGQGGSEVAPPASQLEGAWASTSDAWGQWHPAEPAGMLQPGNCSMSEPSLTVNIDRGRLLPFRCARAAELGAEWGCKL